MSTDLLRSIFSPSGLSVLVQPIMRVEQTTTLYGVECLTRGPRGTLFERPDLLFDYIRRKKAEPKLDRMVIKTALHAVSSLPEELRISLNVHASTLSQDESIVDFITANCASANIAPQRVTIEIVEHTPAWNQLQFRLNLKQLREAGASIALDDIGQGQSNYRMVLDAAPDFFKIDMFFTSGCSRDPKRRAVLRSILALAREFNGTAIAEGVESEFDRDVLFHLGINLMQGFLFSRPETVDHFLTVGWPPANTQSKCSDTRESHPAETEEALP